MSTAPQLDPATPNPNGGPRTEAGRAISSQNAVTFGLYAARDFIRPGEETAYQQLRERLLTDLAPVGTLEENLVDEIRRAIWRLDRCAEIEASFTPAQGTPGPVPDPMQVEAQAQLQLSVDRARNQYHRLLHKCTAELRKLQTERRLRVESFVEGADFSQFGLCDWAFIRKAIDAQFIAGFRRRKLQATAELEELLSAPLPASSSKPGSICKTENQPESTPRNAPCPCGSGQKYKRCCGKNAMPFLHAA